MAKAEYLKKLQNDKATLKVFLNNGTMLQGKISDFDEESIVLDKCLIFNKQIISMVPL